MCVRHIIGRGGSLLLTLAPEREKFTYFQLHKKWMPRSAPGGWPGLQMNRLEQWSVFPVMQKWQTRFCFSKWCEKEKRNSNPFFKVMRKRKTQFISVFQSDAKAKNEIRSSKPFFKVRRKRKAKSKIQICLSMSCENEEWIRHLNSFFSCHRKTVGTKVHALLHYFLFNGWFASYKWSSNDLQ